MSKKKRNRRVSAPSSPPREEARTSSAPGSAAESAGSRALAADPSDGTHEVVHTASVTDGGYEDPEALHHVKAPPGTPHDIARRQLLGQMSVAVGVVGGAAVSFPGVAFVVAPLFREQPREWRSVGKVGVFKIGETVNVVFVDASPLPWAGVTSKTSAWLRRVSDVEFIAFSVNCAHLGCPVRWLESARLFMCPCHGGVYYEDGKVAAGPPPHPLTRYPVRVREGEVEIRTDPIPIG